MSGSTSKHVLFVGNENLQLDLVKAKLKAKGVKVCNATAKQVSLKFIQSDPVDLIIFNEIEDENLSTRLFDLLKTSNIATDIPIFSYIRDSSKNIQKSLYKGAADYITINEDVASIIQKINAVIDNESVFSGSGDIDISAPEVNISTKGIRVFVVEDDPLLRNLLSIRLERSAFPHEFSKDGKDIISALLGFRPDIIILDIMLPGISGFDVLKEIKEHRELSDLPIIVFSNRDGADDRTKAAELGADKFYVKAMTDLSELVLTIEKLTKAKQS